MTPLALTIPEVCASARIGRTRVYEAIRSGELLARKHGKRTLILYADLRQWLEALRPARQALRLSPPAQRRSGLRGWLCFALASPWFALRFDQPQFGAIGLRSPHRDAVHTPKPR
jgi:excisionase family DNA binding protein